MSAVLIQSGRTPANPLAWPSLPSRDDGAILQDGFGYYLNEAELEAILDSSPQEGNNELQKAISNWRSIKERLFYGAHVSLESLLPDCSNVLEAKRGTVERSFRCAVIWYSIWFLIIHTNTFGEDELLDLKCLMIDLRDLRNSHFEELQGTARKHSKSDTPVPKFYEQDKLTGIYKFPDGIREWADPWYFWSVMDIRQLAHGQAGYFPETLILNGCLKAELDLSKELFELNPKLAEDKPTVIELDEESFPWLSGDHAITEYQKEKDTADECLHWIIKNCVDLYQYHALRHWTLRLRPWFKLYLVIDESDRMVEEAVIRLQEMLKAHPHGERILNVHPIMQRQLPTTSCVIAAMCEPDELSPGTLVLKTKCGHVFCASDVLRFWHAANSGHSNGRHAVFSCPLCRSDQSTLSGKFLFEHEASLARRILDYQLSLSSSSDEGEPME
ncbi:MAG: hypothetical protein M1840_001904 [Geoglossum simile]|nr:MAG: hypothetical protein M1840_001904 [Geoglossum simile]